MNLIPQTIGSLFNLAGPDLLVLLVVPLAFVTWMVIDCAVRETAEDNLKLVWMLVILFAPFGSLIYFFVRKLNRVSPPRLPQ